MTSFCSIVLFSLGLMLSLCRSRHETLSFSSNLLAIFTLSLYSSPFSTYHESNFTNRKRRNTTKQSTLLSTLVPRASTLLPVSSDADSICSLLSDRNVKCREFDDSLNEYKEKLNSNLVLQILMNYRQLGRAKTLYFFSWAGMQMSFQFDDSVVEYMADFLGRRKLFDDMKCLLLTSLSHNGRVSCRVFAICIRFLGRQGRVREAFSLFQEMETTFRCKPDNFVYNNMLYVLCKKGVSGEWIDVALSVFRRIEAPDTYSYSNILVGLCKFGRFETALEVFHAMDRAGVVPTRSAVNILLGELCVLSTKEGAIQKVRVKSVSRSFTILVPNLSSSKSRGTIESAVGVFWAVYGLGFLPSAFVVIQLITELCRMKKMEEAFEILKVVEERKMTCLEEGYSILIQTLCEHGWVEEAGPLFGRMLSLRLNPKVVVYNSLICMLCKLENLVDTENVFKIMKKKRCSPNSVTYTTLVHAYCEAKNWEAAYGLLIEMLSLCLIPNFDTYNLVDKLLKENGKMDLCFKLQGKLESQILLKHCKVGQLEAAYQKLNSMIEKGLYPPIYVCDAFRHAFQKCGKLNIACELLEKMDECRK